MLQNSCSSPIPSTVMRKSFKNGKAQIRDRGCYPYTNTHSPAHSPGSLRQNHSPRLKLFLTAGAADVE